MVETDDGDSLETKQLRRLIAPVTGDNLVALVDQYRRVETEGVYASRDRPHLDPAVLARIAGISTEGIDRNDHQFSDAFGAFRFSFVGSRPGATAPVSTQRNERDVAVRFVRRHGAGA